MILSSDNPLITVIIPTRERADTLETCLQTVVAQTYPNLKIIVSDNCSNDNTKDVVLSFDDKRITYLNTGRRLSMTHNWEFAIRNVTTGWVAILGDDDGLLSGALETVAEIIRETKTKALMSETAFYNWPSLTGNSYGKLAVPLGKGFEVRKGKTWLNKMVSGKVNNSQLPTLYTGGFICSSIINQIREQSPNKHFFQSAIPDQYSSLAISSVVDSFVFMKEPLTVMGLSKHSNGISTLKEEKDVDSPANKFYSEENIPFHSDIPLCQNGRIPSLVQVYIYESYLQSAFIRPKVQSMQHTKQLTITLAKAGISDNIAKGWGQQFSKLHKINYDRVKLRSIFMNLYLRFESYPRSIRKSFNTCFIESPKVPIVNVYEASIVVAAIGLY